MAVLIEHNTVFLTESSSRADSFWLKFASRLRTRRSRFICLALYQQLTLFRYLKATLYPTNQPGAKAKTLGEDATYAKTYCSGAAATLTQTMWHVQIRQKARDQYSDSA